MRILLAIFCGLLSVSPLQADSTTKMNFVFVLIDDLGWADLSCYGSTFYETPHLDALARSGVRFTQAYAACPVCSPTRASIMTGRHPVRVDITDWIPGMNVKQDAMHRFLQIEDRNELPLEEVTQTFGVLPPIPKLYASSATAFLLSVNGLCVETCVWVLTSTYFALLSFFAFSVPNANTVRDSNVSPGFRIVVGKFG